MERRRKPTKSLSHERITATLLLCAFCRQTLVQLYNEGATIQIKQYSLLHRNRMPRVPVAAKQICSNSGAPPRNTCQPVWDWFRLARLTNQANFDIWLCFHRQLKYENYEIYSVYTGWN